MVSGEGSSVTGGCPLSDSVAGKDKHLMFWSCHIYFSCARLGTFVVAAAASGVPEGGDSPGCPPSLLSAGSANMSYWLPLSHNLSHLPLLSSDLIPALKQQHKKRLKPLKNYLFVNG